MGNNTFTPILDPVEERKNDMFTKSLFENTEELGSSSDVEVSSEKTDAKLYIEAKSEQKQEYSLTSLDFFQGGFTTLESWTKVESFQARIVEIDEVFIACECIIDKENQEFEVRDFRRVLFSHLGKLKEHMPLLLVFKERPGSARLDIFDGKDIVDNRLFEIEDYFQGLENSALTKPFNK